MSALNPNEPWQRADQRAKLRDAELDVLIIGGGASGLGVFLDALSRGLRVGLVDQGDFTAGTSSRSTKLAHGGVRYLEQAIKQLDFGKYDLVKEALAERKRLLAMAPHLAWPIEIFTPVRHVIEQYYLRTGLGLYDFLAGSEKLGPSQNQSTDRLAGMCPELDISRLRGGVSYFDGQFDDARFGISMARTGLEMGGMALNHTKVTQLTKANGLVNGARCIDSLTNQRFTLNAKSVVNCTGPWTDTLRAMANPDRVPMMTASRGAHILIKQTLFPQGHGLLIPKTKDGRVLFMLPWQGQTLIGTTDTECALSDDPSASPEDIQYLLETASEWLKHRLLPSDVTAAWAGLRPLVSDPKSESTAGLTRDHVIVQDHGLTTLTGGKWTTWRQMAEDCVDTLVETRGLKANPCTTQTMRLVGARGDTVAVRHALASLPKAIGEHLWHCYGDRALEVLKQGNHEPIIEGLPFIHAELFYLIRYEGACTADDLLKRRWRIGMVDEQAAQALRPFIEQALNTD